MSNLSVEDFLAPMHAKVEGAWNLHSLTENMPLDFFVLFSSSSALFGSPGQANYAAANAFLDGLSRYRHRLGLPSLSINWGPWADVGMAARTQELEDRFEGNALSAVQGLTAFNQALALSEPEIGIIHMTEESRQTFLRPVAGYAYFERLMNKSAIQMIEQNSQEAITQLLSKLKAMPLSERKIAMNEELSKQVCQVMKLDKSKVSPDTALQELGLDSLMALELRNTVSAIAGGSLPATLLFDYPTITALSDFLLEQLFPDDYRPSTPAIEEEQDGLDLIEGMSEDDLNALLGDMSE